MELIEQAGKKCYIKVIKSESELEIAQSHLLELLSENQKQDEIELLSLVISDYEKRAYVFERYNPIEAIKTRMKEKGLKQKDIAQKLGIVKPRVSELMNYKRKLTLCEARKLQSILDISIETLIQDYELQTPKQ